MKARKEIVELIIEHGNFYCMQFDHADEGAVQIKVEQLHQMVCFWSQSLFKPQLASVYFDY